MIENDPSTRDMAVRAMQKIDSHTDACERRYQEWNGRMEKLFEFIKDAHSENRKDIGQIMGVLAEQRGAGKMAKILAGGLAAGVGAVSGFLSGHIGR